LSGLAESLITQACECYANNSPAPTTSKTTDVTITTTTQATITGTISKTTSTTLTSTVIATSTLVIGLYVLDYNWDEFFGPQNYCHDPYNNETPVTYSATTILETVLNDCANLCINDDGCIYGIEVFFYTPDDEWWCMMYKFFNSL